MNDLILRLLITAKDMTRGATESVRKNIQSVNDEIARVKTAVTAFIATWASITGIGKLIDMADAWALLSARIKNVVSTTQEQSRIQGALFASAQKVHSAYEALVTLYTRTSDALKKAGFSEQQRLNVTKLTAETLKISGAAQEEVNSSIQQFAQAMAKGKLNGDEFNSMAENSPRFMQALEDALGKTRGELYLMAEAGQLTASVIASALLSQSAKIDAELKNIPLTVKAAWGSFTDDILRYVGTANQADGTTQKLAAGIKNAGQYIPQMASSLVTLVEIIAVRGVRALADWTVAQTEAVLASRAQALADRQAAASAAESAAARLQVAQAFLAATRAQVAESAATVEQLALEAALTRGTELAGVTELRLAEAREIHARMVQQESAALFNLERAQQGVAAAGAAAEAGLGRMAAGMKLLSAATNVFLGYLIVSEIIDWVKSIQNAGEEADSTAEKLDDMGRATRDFADAAREMSDTDLAQGLGDIRNRIEALTETSKAYAAQLAEIRARSTGAFGIEIKSDAAEKLSVDLKATENELQRAKQQLDAYSEEQARRTRERDSEIVQAHIARNAEEDKLRDGLASANARALERELAAVSDAHDARIAGINRVVQATETAERRIANDTLRTIDQLSTAQQASIDQRLADVTRFASADLAQLDKTRKERIQWAKDSHQALTSADDATRETKEAAARQLTASLKEIDKDYFAGRAALETQSQEEREKIYAGAVQTYRGYIGELDTLEKQHRDKAKAYAKQAADYRKQLQTGLAEINAAGQNADTGIDNAYLARQQQLLEAEKTARAGTIEDALKQYESVAAAAKQAAQDEQQAIQAGSGSYTDKLGYIAQYQQALKAAAQLAEQQGQAEAKQADAAKAAADKARKELEALDTLLKSIQTSIAKGFNVQIKTNAAQVSKELDNLAQKSGATPPAPSAPASSAPAPTDAKTPQQVSDQQQLSSAYDKTKQEADNLGQAQAAIQPVDTAASQTHLQQLQAQLAAAQAKFNSLETAGDGMTEPARQELLNLSTYITQLIGQINAIPKQVDIEFNYKAAGSPKDYRPDQIQKFKTGDGQYSDGTDAGASPAIPPEQTDAFYDNTPKFAGASDSAFSAETVREQGPAFQQQQAALAAIKNELSSMPALDIDTEQAGNDIQQLQTDLDGITPPDVTVNADASAVDAAIAKIDSIPTEKTVTIKTVYADAAAGGNAAAPAGSAPTPTGFSTGVTLPGFGGGDKHPALLESGEAVSNKYLVRDVQQKTGIKDYQMAVRYLITPGQYAFGGMAGTPDKSLRSAPAETNRIPAAAAQSAAALTPIHLHWPGGETVGPLLAEQYVADQLRNILSLATLQYGRRVKR